MQQSRCWLRRQQLQWSEELRQQGQRALGELKQEFEELTSDIAEGGLDDSPIKPQATAGPAVPSGAATSTVIRARSMVSIATHKSRCQHFAFMNSV